MSNLLEIKQQIEYLVVYVNRINQKSEKKPAFEIDGLGIYETRGAGKISVFLDDKSDFRRFMGALHNSESSFWYYRNGNIYNDRETEWDIVKKIRSF